MGFQDLNAFNLAMLAKQAWRLIQNTHFLFHRVYKARYCPRSSFLKAELGPNPSFVWRSLLEARDIIMEGSRWQVGDGRTIEVATHVWLPHTSSYLPTGTNTEYASLRTHRRRYKAVGPGKGTGYFCTKDM